MNLGLPKEIKTKEHRVALVPEDVKILVEAGHQVFLENSAGTAAGFPNEEYQKARATIVSKEEVYQQPLIVRVKEPPIETLRENQIIMSFLHIEKDQNPILLNALLQNNITSYAFEEIRDPKTKHRLVSLGFEAGIVGMFEGLRNYGSILEKQGKENIFKNIKPMKEYKNKAKAYLDLREIDPRDFKANIYITGYGKVSKGAQEVLAQLSHPPIILREEDTVRTTVLNKEFAYIWKHLPKIDLFVNAIAWTPDQSRILTKEDLNLMKNNTLIVDISCDENGGIETCRATNWEQPTYEIITKSNKLIIHQCIDNLPSAMAHDSSTCLSQMVLSHLMKVANGERLETGLMTTERKFVFAYKA